MARARDISVERGIFWRVYEGKFGRTKRLFIRFPDGKGGTAKRRIHSNSITRARAELGRVWTKINEGEQPKRYGRITFAQLAVEYDEWARAQRYYVWKRSAIKRMVKLYGDRKLTRIDAKLLEQHQTSRSTVVKSSTINREISLIKHMVRKSVDWSMAPVSCLFEVQKVRMLPERNARLRYLTTEEIDELLAACDHPVIQTIVTIALFTGMRRGEILRLRWDQIDRRNGYILLEADQTKAGKRREIPLAQQVLDALASLPRSLHSPYVFPSKKRDGHMTRIQYQFERAVKTAKLKDFRFHDLRHTFASHLVMAGHSLALVKDLLGHASIQMTLRYAHLAPGQSRSAVSGLYQIARPKSAINANRRQSDTDGEGV